MAKNTRRKIFYSVIGLLSLTNISCKDDKNNILNEESKSSSNPNDIKIGWNEFYQNGSKFKSELLIIEGKPFVNQVIKFNKKGEVDTLNSKFFNIYLDDTLRIGTNVGLAKLFTYNKPVDVRSSSIIVENSYPDGTTEMDTFVGDPKELKFGVYGSREGNKKIKGKISEIVLAIGKDSLFKLKLTSYFEKEVYFKGK